MYERHRMDVYNITPIITCGLYSTQNPLICPQKWDHPYFNLTEQVHKMLRLQIELMLHDRKVLHLPSLQLLQWCSWDFRSCEMSGCLTGLLVPEVSRQDSGLFFKASNVHESTHRPSGISQKRGDFESRSVNWGTLSTPFNLRNPVKSCVLRCKRIMIVLIRYSCVPQWQKFWV